MTLKCWERCINAAIYSKRLIILVIYRTPFKNRERSAYRISSRDFSYFSSPSGVTCSLPILHTFKYFRDESLGGSTMQTLGINFESLRLFSVCKMQVLSPRAEISVFRARRFQSPFRVSGFATHVDFPCQDICTYLRKRRLGDKSFTTLRMPIPIPRN